MSIIYGSPSGGFGMPKMIEISDDNGNTFVGTVTDSEVVLDATRADVKVGKVFASNDGIEEGTDTKTYRTQQGFYLIDPGQQFSIKLPGYDQYNYTKLQCMIAPFNTSVYDSYAIDKVVLNDGVFMTNSVNKIADVTKNDQTKSIDLNITNNSDSVYFIYFFTYKEEYSNE